MTIKNRISLYKKECIAALFLLLLLLVLDWWLNRPSVTYKPPESQREVASGTLEQERSAPLREGTALQAYLASFAVEEEADTEVQPEDSGQQALMDDEMQAQQQGLLRELYIGDKSYRLQAVIQMESAVAIFREEHIPNGTLQTVTLRQGETLGPYTLRELSLTQASLSRDNRVVYLGLFVPARSFEQGTMAPSDTDSSEQAVNGDS